MMPSLLGPRAARSSFTRLLPIRGRAHRFLSLLPEAVRKFRTTPSSFPLQGVLVRRPWLPLAVASAAALLGGQLAFAGPVSAAPDAPAAKPAPAYPADSLRALASKVGLRFGTAINMDLLNTDAKYTQIAADQFSSVTEENVMKWSELEATRGTYTWEKADALVAFAKKNKQ